MSRRKSALKRGKPPKRKNALKKSRKPIKQANKARLRKRLVEYRKFMASAEWAVIRHQAIERAGRRCEFVFGDRAWRCPQTTCLTVHHVRYTRFGGDELPRDLQCLCQPHHDLAELAKGTVPLWKRAK